MDSLLSISIFTLSTSLYARNTRKFVNASRKTTAFLVTYFGRFGNILTNPTKILCEGPLQTLLAATPIPSTTFQFLELPVSRTGVAAAMQSVWAELHATLGFDRVIMVHLGADGSQVDRDTASIKLETRGEQLCSCCNPSCCYRSRRATSGSKRAARGAWWAPRSQTARFEPVIPLNVLANTMF